MRARRVTYRRPHPKQIIIIIIIVLDDFNRIICRHARSRRANSSESCRGREHCEWWSPINIYSSSQPPRCARKNTHSRHGASSRVSSRSVSCAVFVYFYLFIFFLLPTTKSEYLSRFQRGGGGRIGKGGCGGHAFVRP